jgi:hypothetical protein
MIQRIVALLLTAALLSACTTSTPRDPKFSDSDIILDNLHRVKNAQVGVAYLDPQADFGRFSKILLDPLDMSRTEIIQPARTTSAVARRPTELTERNIETIQNAFADVFTRELEETGDYQVVSEPGPDVLRVSATITQIAPTAPGDSPGTRTSGRVRVFTEGAGAMAIAFAFSDSETNEVLAVVKDARSGTPTWGVNNSVTNLSDVRFIFGRWARMLRARLDIAHGF